MDAEHLQPARAREAFHRWRPPHPRRDKGPPWRAIHDLARSHAPHRLHPGLHEEGERGVRTPPPIRHKHLTGGSHRVSLLPLGKIMGEEGGDHQLQEHPSARMKASQPPRHGKATPQPWHVRLAKGVLEGRRIGHGAA
jgi:hypothetical protein